MISIARVRDLGSMLRGSKRRAALRFIGSRVVRTQHHVVFRHDLQAIAEPQWPKAAEVIRLRDASDLDRSLEARLLALSADNAPYLRDVREGRCAGLVVCIDGEVAHFSFVLHGSKTLCLLGLAPDAALLGNAFTVPRYRGRGLQTQSIPERLRMARERGFAAAFAETAPSNIASRKAISRGGMQCLGAISLIVVLNSWALRCKADYPCTRISRCTRT